MIAEDGGDLGGRQALHADQQRDLEVGRRELGERALEGELRLRVRERLERRAIRRGGAAHRQVTRELRPHRLGPAPAHDQAVGHREQPRPEPGVLGQAPRAPGEAEELTGFVGGLVATCRYVIDHPDALAAPLPVLQGVSESCSNLVLGDCIAVITWILVAVGIRRMPHDA